MTSASSASSDAPDQEIISLYQMHAAGLRRYGTSLLKDSQLAEDLVHEVFLRFVTERTLGRCIENPEAWFYRVLRNLALDRLRKAQHHVEVPVAQVQNQLKSSSSPQEALEYRQMIDKIGSILTGRELQCFRSRSEGRNYEEIAEDLGVRVGTVGTLLARAYKKTRQLLTAAGPSPTARPA